MEKTKQVSIKEELPVLNAESLILKGIESNIPVETMERLLAMRRELKAEFAQEEFNREMAEFQRECPVIKKEKSVANKDKTPRYKYAPLDAIIKQTRDLITKHGFSYSFDSNVKEKAVEAICTVTHKLGHLKTSTFEVPTDPEAYMNAPQKFASALTFAKRYAFTDVFGILTGEDDNDAQSFPIDTPARPADLSIKNLKGALSGSTDEEKIADLKKKTHIVIKDFNITDKHAGVILANVLASEVQNG